MIHSLLSGRSVCRDGGGAWGLLELSGSLEGLVAASVFKPILDLRGETTLRIKNQAQRFGVELCFRSVYRT